MTSTTHVFVVIHQFEIIKKKPFVELAGFFLLPPKHIYSQHLLLYDHKHTSLLLIIWMLLDCGKRLDNSNEYFEHCCAFRLYNTLFLERSTTLLVTFHYCLKHSLSYHLPLINHVPVVVVNAPLWNLYHQNFNNLFFCNGIKNYFQGNGLLQKKLSDSSFNEDKIVVTLVVQYQPRD
jgi:hypothetical protein